MHALLNMLLVSFEFVMLPVLADRALMLTAYLQKFLKILTVIGMHN
jgi:hypothetical protein